MSVLRKIVPAWNFQSRAIAKSQCKTYGIYKYKLTVKIVSLKCERASVLYLYISDNKLLHELIIIIFYFVVKTTCSVRRYSNFATFLELRGVWYSLLLDFSHEYVYYAYLFQKRLQYKYRMGKS